MNERHVITASLLWTFAVLALSQNWLPVMRDWVTKTTGNVAGGGGGQPDEPSRPAVSGFAPSSGSGTQDSGGGGGGSSW